MKAGAVTNTADRIDIFSYDDYRSYLRDVYLQKKGFSSKVTYRSLSRDAGFRAPNFLHLVMNGKRNLSFHSIRKISRMLDLGVWETSYFENLVHFNQAKTHEDQLHYFRGMIQLRQKSNTKILEDQQSGLFDHWYYTVVRELCALTDFQDNPDWITRKLGNRISHDEAHASLEFLIREGFIRRDENNCLRPSDPQIKTRDRETSNVLNRFHSDMIELSKQSLQAPRGTRHITGMTLSVSPARFYLIIHRIISFQEDIRQILEQDIPESTLTRICKNLQLTPENAMQIDRVAQINTQLFTLTQNGETL